MEKSVRLNILGNNTDAKAKIAAVQEKADALATEFPELKIGIDAAQAQAQLKILRDEMAQGSDSADLYAKALENVSVASDKMAESQSAQSDAFERLTALQRSGTASADELAAAENELTSASLRAADARERLAGAEANVAAVTKTATDEQVAAGLKTQESAKASTMLAGAWGKAKLALLGVGAAIGYGAVKAEDFQQKMEMIHTEAGVAQEKLGGLSQGVLQLAGQVGFSPTSLSTSLYHVASNMKSMGATGTQMMNAVKIAAEGAQVGQADLEDVTNALGAAIASGIPGVQNYQQAMGALLKTVGAGDMSMQDLAEALGSGVLAVVKGYGVTLNDVGASLATFGDNNIRGALAATDLRMAVQALAAPAKAGQEQLITWGVKQGDLSKDMREHGLIFALEHLQKLFRANGVDAKEQGQYITNMFGKRAGSGLAVLMGQLDRLEGKQKEVSEGASGFGNAWKSQAQTVHQQFADLKSGADALAVQLGSVFLPAVIKIVHGLSSFFNMLNKNKVLAVSFVAAIGALAGAVGFGHLVESIGNSGAAIKSLWSLGGSTIGMFQRMAVSLGIVTAAQDAQTAATEAGTVAEEGMDAAFAISPLGWIVIAITAVIAVVVLMVTHWKQVKEVAVAAWNGIKSAASSVWGWLKSAFSSMGHTLAKPFQDAASAVMGVFNRIKSFVVSSFDGWWKNNGDAIKQIWRAIWGGISAIFHTWWTATTAIARAGWTVLSTVFRAGIGVINAVWRPFWAILSTVAKAAWTVITTLAKAEWIIVKAVFETGVSAVRAVWSVLWSVVTATAKEAWAIVSTVVKVGWDVIVGIFGVSINLITGHWRNAWIDMKNMVTQVWNAVKSLFRSSMSNVESVVNTGLNAVTGFFRSLGSRIRGAVGNLGSLLVNAGRSLIDGLLHGIQSAFGAVMNTIQSIGSKISGAFKSVMGIFSPSRVFAGHGKNIVLGLVAGISGNAHLAESAVQGMAQRAINASSGHFSGRPGIAGGAAGGAPVTVNINGVVTDPTGTARQIAQLLNQYNRQGGKAPVFV